MAARGDDSALETALRQALALRPEAMLPNLPAAPDPELLELRQRIAYYDQGLRFQMADKLFRLLSKYRPIFRLSEAVGRRLWKLTR